MVSAPSARKTVCALVARARGRSGRSTGSLDAAMSRYVIVLVAIFTWDTASALTGCPGGWRYFSNEAGKPVMLALSEVDLMRTPQWSPMEGDPPLSIAKASSIARAHFAIKRPGVSSLVLHEIELVPARCPSGERWYYVFQFATHQRYEEMPGWLVIAVLMDGTLIEPVPSPAGAPNNPLKRTVLNNGLEAKLDQPAAERDR
jgi:hypothetical protein